MPENNLPLIDNLLLSQEISPSEQQEILELSPIGIFKTTPEGRYLFANPTLAWMYGYNTPQELVDSISDIGQQAYVDPADRVEFKELLESQGQVFNHESRLRRKDGSIFWASRNARAVRDIYGKISHYIGFTTDITERKMAEQALRRSENYYRTIFETSGAAQVIIEEDTTISLANSKFEELSGYSRQELEGIKSWTEFVHSEDMERMKQYHYQRRQKRDQVPWRYDFRFIDRGGAVHHIYLNVDTIPDTSQSVASLIDITERKQSEEKIRYLSLHDSLTGLYNRTFFDEEMQRLSNSREFPITSISADIDGLKFINDTMGHAKGDELLQAAARVLQESLRSSDILARVGGDEFALLMPRTDKATGDKIAKRILSSSVRHNHKHPELPLYLSIGTATASKKGMSLEIAYRKADDLMYRQKRAHSQNINQNIVNMLVSALNKMDYIAQGHAYRLGSLCRALGKKLDMPPELLTRLDLLAQVHDLGHVAVPEHILFKPGPLSEEEWDIMRQHAEKGYNIAASSLDLVEVSGLILKHHERFDGHGYPQGLQGQEIPIECRILAIADAFDAMTSNRAYSKGKTRPEALQELKKQAGTQFDPELVQIFIEIAPD